MFSPTEKRGQEKRGMDSVLERKVMLRCLSQSRLLKEGRRKVHLEAYLGSI